MSDLPLQKFPSPMPYQIKREIDYSWLEWLSGLLAYPFVRTAGFVESLNVAGAKPQLDKLMAQAEKLADEDLMSTLQNQRVNFQRSSRRKVRLECLALIAEIAQRNLAWRFDPGHLLAAELAAGGFVVDLPFGIPQNRVSGLAAAVCAWAGETVHVVSCTEFLAAESFASNRALYETLGLNADLVPVEPDPAARQTVYGADICHGSSRQLAFDHLRDRLRLDRRYRPLGVKLQRYCYAGQSGSGVVMRGLDRAIFESADMSLIDLARTPVITSTELRDPEISRRTEVAHKVAGLLLSEDHFEIDEETEEINFTAAGQEQLAELGEEIGGIWRNAKRREIEVVVALTARHLMQLGVHYDVADGKIKMLPMPGNKKVAGLDLDNGLTRSLEAKEGLPISGERQILGRTTFQRFFRQYIQLAGIATTGARSKWALWSIYGLRSRRLQIAPPGKSKFLGLILHVDADEMWRHILDRVRVMHNGDRPVGLVMKSAGAAAKAMEMLQAEGHSPGHVAQLASQEDLDLFNSIGDAGRITVLSGWANQGSLAVLSTEAVTAGGMHLIFIELQDDRAHELRSFNLFALPYMPTSYEYIISRDDPLFQAFPENLVSKFLQLFSLNPLGMVRRAQAKARRQQQKLRIGLNRQGTKATKFLAMAGELE